MRFIISAFVALICAVSAAQAMTFSLVQSGTFTRQGGPDDLFSQMGISAGDAFSLTTVYDAPAAGNAPSFNSVTYPSAISAMVFQYGGIAYDVLQPVNRFIVYDNTACCGPVGGPLVVFDALQVDTANVTTPFQVGGVEFRRLQSVTFVDPGSLTSLLLPATAGAFNDAILAAFAPQSEFFMETPFVIPPGELFPESSFVGGTISDTRVFAGNVAPPIGAVPLPAGGILLLTGVGLLALRRNKRAASPTV